MPSLKSKKLGQEFFQRPDVVAVARSLLGKWLISRTGGVLTGGRIVETEAYCGETDRACHAFGQRITARNATMFRPGGVAYVYLCYGIHTMFNVVSNTIGKGDAVLVRAIEPLVGVDKMLERRKKSEINRLLCGGPGALTQALGIFRELDGEDLGGDTIWIEDRGDVVKDSETVASPRVGVGYARDDANLPWRFRIASSPWTSPAK